MRSASAGIGTLCLAAVLAAGCAPAPAPPAPAVMRETPPPWDAPRDAISYLQVAGVPQLPSGYRPVATRTAALSVTVAGEAVVVPAGIGLDRVRGIESPLHTHGDDGTVWIEETEADRVDDYTLGQFFALWGVRFADGCLGDACRELRVTVDGTSLAGDPASWRWVDGASVQVSADR
jgi:hypothetical protein